MIAYFDTSAFVKLVVDEPGSPVMAAVWEEADRRLSSRLLYPEARAAVAAARRSRRIRIDVVPSVLAELERLWHELDDIELSPELTVRAGDLAHQLDLRGADAVHLATAEASVDAEDVIACADTRLAHGARELGLAVAGA